MIENFEIFFIDQSDYESLLIQIEYKGQILCRLDKENGNDNMKIQFFPDFYIEVQKVDLKFPLNEFIEIIDIAKQQLAACP